MPRSRIGWGTIASAGLALMLSTLGWASPRERQTPAPPAPPAPAAAIALSHVIPGDVTGNGSTLPTLQHDFDVFSWSSFIALNWPPGPDGKGDPAKKPGASGDNATVWERYQESTDTFLPRGQTPVWGGHSTLPPACQTLATPGVRVLTQIDKSATLLEESVQPFDTGPLIDQAGKFARFEILMNRVMFDYIVANTLYSKAGQKAFNAAARFPCGSATAPAAEGAIMVKGAWKIVSSPAEAARFHTSKVLVYTPASEVPKVPESCTAATVGLVGFHIGHKTNKAVQWIWSTFEHEDNAPTEAQVKSGTLEPRYNYYNPACKTCPVNTAAPRPWNPAKTGPPTQVVRLDALPGFATDSATAVNADAKTLLAGVSPKSVWQHYELVSTQWPTHTHSDCTGFPTDPEGRPAPPMLANTTLETFIQGRVSRAQSSCIQCHNNASMTNGKDADFTYLLQRAR